SAFRMNRWFKLIGTRPWPPTPVKVRAMAAAVARRVSREDSDPERIRLQRPSRAAAGRTAGRAFQACAVAHQREVAALAAGVAFEALETGFADPLETGIDRLDERGIGGDGTGGAVADEGWRRDRGAVFLDRARASALSTAAAGGGGAAQ